MYDDTAFSVHLINSFFSCNNILLNKIRFFVLLCRILLLDGVSDDNFDIDCSLDIIFINIVYN